jgi:hypothetical protein
MKKTEACLNLEKLEIRLKLLNQGKLLGREENNVHPVVFTIFPHLPESGTSWIRTSLRISNSGVS